MPRLTMFRSARSLSAGVAACAAALALAGATPALAGAGAPAVGADAARAALLPPAAHGAAGLTAGQNGQAAHTRPAPQPLAGTWATIPAYPTPIEDNVVGSDDGTIYSVTGYAGGSRTTAMYSYTPGGAWKPRASIPVSRENGSGAFIGGRFYVTDGWGPDGSPAASLNVYDPDTDTWGTGASTPAPVSAAGTAVLGGALYTVGGCTGLGCTTTNAVTAYNPASNTWSKRAAYPVKAAYVACAALADTLYCAGGNTGSAQLAGAYAYDPGRNKWSRIADLPEDLSASAYAAVDGSLLVQGGFAANGLTVTNRGYAYDPATDAWTATAAAPAPAARSGSVADASGFYVIGGRPTLDPSTIDSTAQVLTTD